MINSHPNTWIARNCRVYGGRLFRVETRRVFYDDDQHRTLDVAWDQRASVVEAASTSDLANQSDYSSALPDNFGEYIDAIRAQRASGLLVFVDD